MTRRVVLTIAPAILLVLMLIPSLSLGALPTQIVPQDCNVPGGCQSVCDIVSLVQNIVNGAIFLAVVISAILFAWAGAKYISAGDDTEQLKSAKDIFKNVVIGLVIILAAWLIVDTLIRSLTNLGESWGKLC